MSQKDLEELVKQLPRLFLIPEDSLDYWIERQKNMGLSFLVQLAGLMAKNWLLLFLIRMEWN